MDTIVVAGKASGIGKTGLLCRIMGNLKGSSGVIKTAPGEGGFLVTAEPAFLQQENTDTARYLENGADRVVFLRAGYSRLAEALDRAGELIGSRDYLLIEGNSVLDYLSPELIIYLDGDGFSPKPSAARAEARADIILDRERLFSDNLEEFSFNIQEISCYKAHLAAVVLGLPPALVGERLNQQGIKVRQCQLGLF